jgi:DNA-binding NarL/FixJ family response regulator
LAPWWFDRFEPHRHEGCGVTVRYATADQRASTRNLLARDGASPRADPTQCALPHGANGRPRLPLAQFRFPPGKERSSLPGSKLDCRREGGFAVTELVETAEDRRQTEPLRVLLVDDHDLFRTGLRNLLEEQDLVIVGEAGTGAEAVVHVRELTPDVVVMDLNMPAMGGVEATRHIAEVSPLTRVVMLTISDEDSDVTDAILAGACGYLLKDASIQELVSGIRAAARGEALISPHIAAKVLQRIRATSAQPEIEEMIRAELSEREIEVLKLIANGKDNAVIAAELHISPKTVKNHISNILMKLQIDNRIQAAVYAVRSGIV